MGAHGSAHDACADPADAGVGGANGIGGCDGGHRAAAAEESHE